MKKLVAESKKHQWLRWNWWSMLAEHGKLPVPNFSAGGIATPADARLW